MGEIRGEYDKYVADSGEDGKMTTLEGRETGTILVAGSHLTLVTSNAADCISLHSS